VFSSYVAAMIGTEGLSLDILRAVLPLVVNAMMAFDLEISATCEEREMMVRWEDEELGVCKRRRKGKGGGCNEREGVKREGGRKEEKRREEGVTEKEKGREEQSRAE
jgi:hypothetical protein